MKNKGFTLIELLAVIVILAIIALIATPIILGIINDAREESNERSIELYANAIRNAVSRHQLNGGKVVVGNYSSQTLEEKVTIAYDEDVECTTVLLRENGEIYLAGCTVNGEDVNYKYGKLPCSYLDNDNDNKISLSDVVTCGTESFYVMSTDVNNKTVTMLSKYNLNVGDNAYPDGTYGIQNENAVGYNTASTTYYGTVAFETVAYWKDENGRVLEKYGNEPALVYDENSLLYPYIETYESYLKNIGVSSANATIMSYKQAKDLGCNDSNTSCTSAPVWVYLTSYWLGEIGQDGATDSWYENGYEPYHWFVYSTGTAFAPGFDGLNNGSLGVRPVVTISIDEIN